MVCTVIMEIIYVSLLTEKVKGNDMYWGIVAAGLPENRVL